MGHTRSAAALRWAALLGAALLTALRLVTLRTAFDENGLLPRGSRVLPLTVLAAALVFLALTLLSLRLNRLPGTEGCFTSRPGWLGAKLAAAVLLLFGSLFALLDGQSEPDLAERIVTGCGLVSALLMGLTALRPERGPGFFWLRLVPALFTGAALVTRFRTWSHDPLVIHLAPVLLAWTCCMVEMMLLTGFPLNAGHRRGAVLFGLGAGCYCCMTLPDFLLGQRTELPELLTLLGLSVWCLTAALELLRHRVQTELPPPEPEPEQEAQPQPENSI